MKTPGGNAPDLEQMSLFTPESASPPWSALSTVQRATVVRLLAELLAPRPPESTPQAEDRDGER